MLIVIAPVPTPSYRVVDRYLVAANALGVKPVIIVNKEDLLNEDNREQIIRMINLYTALNIDVEIVSAFHDEAKTILTTRLHKQIGIFVGQSGVGKSSLINVVLPQAFAKSGELSNKKNLGQHTTTTSNLYFVDKDSMIIDSPGIREFPLWEMETRELVSAFNEIDEHAAECKFRNCSHVEQAGCAVMTALECGKIAKSRYDNFKLFLTETAKKKTTRK